MPQNQAYYASPVGTLFLTEDGGFLTGLYFHTGEPPIENGEIAPVLNESIKQLTEYFDGKRTVFDIPLRPEGTDFRKTVWNALLTIPYAETETYGGIAKKIDNIKASRAVGSANHNNPISIIIPCHRVIGHNGKLTGYGGGLDKKEWLLNHERRKIKC